MGRRWELLHPLASGGMGDIYVAKHAFTGKQAALKILRSIDEEQGERFRREASASAEIGHPQIVDIFDADIDEDTGSFYIAMELLEGRTLREVMGDQRTTPEQLLNLIRQVLEPLAAAHAKGFVHRDLKPENIFVMEAEGSPPSIKLLDFGIARSEQCSPLTQTGTGLGTPHYMSPEQAMNARSAEAASDIWSVGAMIYESMSGDVPFVGETSHAVVVHACTQEHQPLFERIPEVDLALSALVDRCLAKKPEDRPRSASAVIAELDRLRRGPFSLPTSRKPSLAPGGGLSTSGVRPRAEETTDVLARPVQHLSHLKRAFVLSACGLGGFSLIATALGFGIPAGIILGAASLSMLIASAAFSLRETRPRYSLKKRTQSIAAPEAPELAAAQFPTLGPDDARSILVVHTDLACSKSRRFTSILVRLRSRYPNDVRLEIRPLPRTDREASWLAAECGLEVFEQAGVEAYLALHEHLRAQPRQTTAENLIAIARELNINIIALDHALRVRRHRGALLEERESAEEKHITTSPTLFISGQRYEGNRSENAVRWAIEDSLKHTQMRMPDELHTEISPEGPSKMGLDQILVRYSGGRGAPSELARSREEARLRAERLLARARMPKTDFGDLALRFGDGPPCLGVVEISLLDEHVCRSLASLPVGGFSEVLENDAGFVVFHRFE